MNNGPILLVEDNPDDELLTVRSLTKINLRNEIVVARDGAEALDRLFGDGDFESDGPLRPEVVLLDIKLPKISGLEVLERIRNAADTRLTPVVILTSSTEEEDVMRGYELGVNSYVRKPIDFKKFSEAVSILGLYWVLVNEPQPKKG